MLDAKDVNQIFIGAAAALSTGGVDNLNVGEVGAFLPDGTRITGANDTGVAKFYLHAKLADGTFKKSDMIDVEEVLNAKGVAGADDQESIDYIGYNGTSGDIEELTNNNYFVSVNLQELFESHSDGRRIGHARATTGTTADKHAVAQELVKDAIRNMGITSRESEPWLKAELVSGAAGVAATGTGDITVQKGSPYITAATAIDAVLNVGDFIRLGGTATTDVVYKVVSLDAVNEIAKLDTVYQGDSGVILTAATEVVTAAAFDGAAVGVKITSLPNSFDPRRIGRSRFSKNIYDFSLGGFGSTPLTSVQSADKGTNAAEVVAEMEYANQRFEYGDNLYEVGEPNLFRGKANTDLSEDAYDSINLAWRHRLTGGFRDDMSNKELTVFTPASAEPAWLSDATNGLRTVLESVLGLATDGLEG